MAAGAFVLSAAHTGTYTVRAEKRGWRARGHRLAGFVTWDRKYVEPVHAVPPSAFFGTLSVNSYD
jgi:hypothetical protein